MGCDIHIIAEVREDGTWKANTREVFPLDEWEREYYKKSHAEVPFDWRSYSMFGLFANVRNYDHCTSIAAPRGIPEDASEAYKSHERDWEGDGHSHSYLTLRELIEFDYDKVFWNRRITRQEGPNTFNGAAIANEGEGRHLSQRENLGEQYFQHLEALKTLGAPDDVRIVFFFDN